MRTQVKSFLRDESGSTAVEYGLILSLMTIICIAGFVVLASGAGGMWGNIASLLGGALK